MTLRKTPTGKPGIAKPVVFEGRVPEMLRTWVVKHVSRQVHLVRQTTEGGLRYETELRIGWKCYGEHVAVAHTVPGMIERLSACVRCKCAKCGA